MTSTRSYTLQILFGCSLWLSACTAANIPMPSLRSNRISNSLSANNENSYFESQDWVKVSEAPPQIVNQPIGARVELECEAVGSPSPTIQWIKGTTTLTENDSYESNMISDTINQGLSKIKSRLIINSLLPVHQGPFTCVATSGSQTALATTNIFVLQGKLTGQRNFSDYLNTNMIPLAHPKVRIVLFNTIVMELMGTDLILPCKAVGSPKPDIFWIDANNEQIISNQDPRFKVLADGELRIKDLSWPDMGAYTCVARNDYSKDTITTFVYPVLNEN
ncbi:Ecdysone-inducible gene L2 [Carabus blaptoides fortunei]